MHTMWEIFSVLTTSNCQIAIFHMQVVQIVVVFVFFMHTNKYYKAFSHRKAPTFSSPVSI